MSVPEVRWPLLAEYLADPLAPSFPVAEYLADPQAKYARSTAYRFHRRNIDFREIGVIQHRPLLSTGPVDLPATDDFLQTDLCKTGLEWARSPLPGAHACNAEWGPLFMHQTDQTVELLGGCVFPLKIVDFSREQAAVHYTYQEDLAERWKRIHSVMPLCTGRRSLGRMRGPNEWSENATSTTAHAAEKRGGGQTTRSGKEAMRELNSTEMPASRFETRQGMAANTAEAYAYLPAYLPTTSLLALSDIIYSGGVLAHRGCRDFKQDVAQNTLKAFRTGLEHGACGIELDVHTSADGKKKTPPRRAPPIYYSLCFVFCVFCFLVFVFLFFFFVFFVF